MPRIGKKIKPYVMKEDRGLPKEEQTVFLFRVAPHRETMDLIERISGLQADLSGIEQIRAVNAETVDILNQFTDGWKNLLTDNGSEREFVPGSKDNWDWCDLPQIGELIEAVQQINMMTPDEQKN